MYNGRVAGPALDHGGTKRVSFPDELYGKPWDHKFKDKDQAIKIAKRLKQYIIEQGDNYLRSAIGKNKEKDKQDMTS